MINEVRHVLENVTADIPGFPAYLALIVPGLCAWLFIWAKEKKENIQFLKDSKDKSPPNKVDSNDSR